MNWTHGLGFGIGMLLWTLLSIPFIVSYFTVGPNGMQQNNISNTIGMWIPLQPSGNV